MSEKPAMVANKRALKGKTRDPKDLKCKKGEDRDDGKDGPEVGKDGEGGGQASTAAAAPACDLAAGDSGADADMADEVVPTAADDDDNVFGEPVFGTAAEESTAPPAERAAHGTATASSTAIATTEVQVSAASIDSLADIRSQLAALTAMVTGVARAMPTVSTIAAGVNDLRLGFQRLEHTVTEHGDRLDTHGTQLLGHQARIERLEKQVRDLTEARATGAEGPAHAAEPASQRPAATAAASPAQPVPAAAPAADPPAFTPSYVEAKGWCTFQERGTKGYTKPQCATIVDALRAELDGVMAARLGHVQVRGLRNYAFRVPVQGGLVACREVSGIANDLSREGRLQQAAALPAGTTLRWTIERSPDDQLRVANLLRVLRAAEKVVQNKTAGGEAQWAGVSAVPNWRDFAVELLGLPRGAQTVCTIAQGGTHQWNPEGLRVMGFDHPGPFLASAPEPPR